MLLLSLRCFFAATLGEALQSSAQVILIRFRTDSGIFNIRRLQAKTKVYLQLVRDLLFADVCGALCAHTEDHLQILMNHFSAVAGNFGHVSTTAGPARYCFLKQYLAGLVTVSYEFKFMVTDRLEITILT